MAIGAPPILRRPRPSWCGAAGRRPGKGSGSRAGKARMSDFSYLALDTAGGGGRGSVRAESAEEARQKLQGRRLFVVKMEAATGESAPPLLSRQVLSRRRLSAK